MTERGEGQQHLTKDKDETNSKISNKIKNPAGQQQHLHINVQILS